MTTADGVARVCVDSPLPHLDRLFDYAIPAKLAGVVDVGSRVRVPFAGRLVSAVVCEIARDTSFGGDLASVRTSSALPSYSAPSLALARAIADRHGGSLWDVLRLMAPPRVASVERRAWDGPPADLDDRLRAALDHLLDGGDLPAGIGLEERVVWSAVPERGRGREHGPIPARALLALAAAAALAVREPTSGSSIIVVPDARSIGQVLAVARDAGLRRWTSRAGGDIAVVHSSDGPSIRYSSYLAAMRGEARIVLGTRPAALTPVPRLAHLSVWDDAHSAYDERHAPYPRVLAIAATRAEREEAGVVVAGFAPSVAARALAEHGWARATAPDRAAVRDATAHVIALTGEERDREGGSGWHWMPSSAWRSARDALERGPVLVLVPRAGYVQGVACASCREWARCRECGGTLSLDSGVAAPVCLDCGAANADWHCPECGSGRLAHARQGVERIAEQLSAMAPGRDVVTSSSGTSILGDGAFSGFVVATPGAVPANATGYALAVLVDAGALLGSGLDGEQDAIRHVLSAAAHTRTRGDDGSVVVVGRLPDAVARCVSTWSPDAWAEDSYRERASLGLPPVRRVVEAEGSADALRAAGSVTVEERPLASHADVREVTVGADSRVFLATRRVTQAVVDAWRALQVERSRSGLGDLRIRVDGPLRPGA